MKMIQVCVILGVEKIMTLGKIFVKSLSQMIVEEGRRSDQRRSGNDDK